MQKRLLPFQGPRLVIFTGVIIVIFALLILRTYHLQFVEYDSSLAAARENSVQSVPLPAPRGVIYDRYGKALALNAPAFNVSITPAALPDDENETLRVLNRLAALIEVPATRAAADAAGKRFVVSLQEMVIVGQGIAPYRPVIVASDVPQGIAQTILEDIANLPGVRVEAISVRQYPSGSTTAQIVGYLGPIGAEEADKLREQGYNPSFERVGYAGVEAYLDEELSGKRGLLTQTVDVAGLPITVIQRDPPVAGRNIRLTLDLTLQKFAEQQLQDRINIINAEAQKLQTLSGVVIAMNPQTGEILAMVSLPTYDNTRFARSIDGEYYLRIAKEPQTPLVNHAIQSLYPPGSVWKLISAAGILQEKVIAADYQLYDGGDLFIENKFAVGDIGQRQRFVCWLRTGHQRVDMVHGIAWSCDVYFYQVGGGNPDPNLVALRPGGLGIRDLYRYATALNIGVETGIELPYENPGQMPDETWKRRVYGESWSTGDTYNAAFGQGYVVTSPIQLLSATSALMNGGTLYQPTIIREWLDAEGNVIIPFTPRVHRTVTLPPVGQPIILNLKEDMLIRGKNSLACTCEPRSPYRNPENPDYDPNLQQCTDDFVKNYRGQVNHHEFGVIDYQVNIPYGYIFGGVCNQRQINDSLYSNYQPPFVAQEYIRIIEQGMYEAVMNPEGTAKTAALGYIQVGGKTGTAEYCDDIAFALGLCKQGEWPSHAWYVGYAPFENPEIAVIAFVYNAGEGSKHSLPIVKNVIDCYFRLKTERGRLGANADLPPCNIPQQ
ncbi:MAG TPA: penicillin-binding transpeptidase domain-containing protein [Aggregatilineales bacterium]|nr:penicillin-binding transpeptidase domain-containing protein [Aggregatilineales bacterium]